jgi:acetyl-CoA carboxylase biotin carboxyl carrier protein
MADKNGPDKNGKFDTGLIRELAAILREADLGEIEIEQGDLRIKVSKPEAAAVSYSAPVYAQPAPGNRRWSAPSISPLKRARRPS